MSDEITIYRGDTQTLTFQITDKNGNAVDLTDWSITITVKEKETDPDVDALLQLSTPYDIAKTESQGEIVVYLQPSHTIDGTPMKHVYDIELTDPDGNVFTAIKDVLVLSGDITIGS